jgi:RNA-directed DNA polymerase
METLTLSKLILIAERAQRDPLYRFTCLAHLLDEGFLKTCYLELGKDRASGVDGVSWQEYGKQMEGNLKDLVERMKAKRYKPQPAKRVYIPKDENSKRPLGLPALEDKIVQRGMARILGAIYEQDFLDCSYGFRPKRGCHQALKAVNTIFATERINHVVEADIKGFFDHVNHEWMMTFLGRRINDPSFLLLIQRFLKAGYVEADELVETEEGTPQGGNLSPMLSNIFLHEVLDVWFEKEIRPQLRGKSHLARYADDFICMVQYVEDAQFMVEALRKRFAQYGLELHPDKTRVMSFGRYEEENARRQGRKPNAFDFLGFKHFCGRSRKGNFLLGRMTSGKKYQKKIKDMNAWLKAVRGQTAVKEWWPTLQAKLRGHYQYYGVSGNYAAISQFYRQTLTLVLRWLNRRGDKASFNGPGFAAYLARYPLPKPKIMHNFYTLSFGT